MQLGSEFRLLAPGTYEWNSTMVVDVQAVDITTAVSQLGPYTLLTTPQGKAAVTYHHGTLRILGLPETRPRGAPESSAACDHVNASAVSRTFFMDDPNWVHKGFLSTQMQTVRQR